METMKVKPWSEDQGEFVLINEADFDPAVHEKYDEAEAELLAKTQREAAEAARLAAEQAEAERLAAEQAAAEEAARAAEEEAKRTAAASQSKPAKGGK